MYREHLEHIVALPPTQRVIVINHLTSLERARLLALVRHSSRKPVRTIVATVQRTIKNFEAMTQGWSDHHVRSEKEAKLLVNKILGLGEGDSEHLENGSAKSS